MKSASEPTIKNFNEIKFVGKRIQMSFVANKVVGLWRSFMPVRNKIENAIGSELYSIEVFHPTFFKDFNPATEFDKWAAVAVTDFDTVPDDMETISTDGLYAVFVYKGSASEGQEFFQYIFQTWLPNSDYLLDDRPHMAIMGEKYKNNDPDSEEELCIPVKPK